MDGSTGNRTRRGRIWLTILTASVLSGCVTVKVAQPILPVPEWPEVRWEVCQPQRVCLTEPDGNRINKFIDKWNAYRHALERLTEDRALDH